MFVSPVVKIRLRAPCTSFPCTSFPCTSFPCCINRRSSSLSAVPCCINRRSSSLSAVQDTQEVSSDWQNQNVPPKQRITQKMLGLLGLQAELLLLVDQLMSAMQVATDAFAAAIAVAAVVVSLSTLPALRNRGLSSLFVFDPPLHYAGGRLRFCHGRFCCWGSHVAFRGQKQCVCDTVCDAPPCFGGTCARSPERARRERACGHHGREGT